MAAEIVSTSAIKRVDPPFKRQPRFCLGERVQLRDGRMARFEGHRVGRSNESLVVIEDGSLKTPVSRQYTTSGNVCGPCGHQHATVITAEKCRRAHAAAVRRHNGPNSYSDRNVVRLDADGETSPISENEYERLLEWQEAQDVR